MKKQLDVLYVSNKKIQKAISKPIPKKIIDCFYDTPLTASQIADAVSFPKDKIYYHIKKLIVLDILFVSETEEVKGIVQKKFLPTSSKIIFGNAPKKSKPVSETKEKKIKDDLPKPKIIIEQSRKVPINVSSLDQSIKPEEKEITDLKGSLLPPRPLTSDSYNRIISDRRKSRNRRTSFQRRSNLARRIKQSFKYNGPERRVQDVRRNIQDRRIINSRRIKNDRRLEGEVKAIKRSINKISSGNSE